MRKDIHPDYHEITVEMTDGSKFKTKSCWGKKGGNLKLDVDVLTHPVWTGGTNFVNENASNIAKFKSKFGSLSFGAKKEEEEEKK